MPSEIGNQQHLTTYKNPLGGTISEEIYDISGNFIVLAIANSNLSGTLSPNINQLTSLQWLAVRGNRMTNSLPELGGLTRLENTDSRIDETSLSASASWHVHRKRSAIADYFSQLSSTIPSGIGRCTNWVLLGIGVPNTERIGKVAQSHCPGRVRFAEYDGADYGRTVRTPESGAICVPHIVVAGYHRHENSRGYV